MFVIGCHAEFCTLNPVQVALDENNQLLKFEEICEADNFLAEKGFSADIINDCFFYMSCLENETTEDIGKIIDRHFKELKAEWE